MSKEIKIKSNGLRNELKAINKTLDKLTSVLETMLDLQYAQTIKQNEKVYRIPDDARWVSDYSFCVDLEQGKDYHGTMSKDVSVD